MQALSRLFQLYNFPQRSAEARPHVAAIEEKIGIQLPMDYKRYLSNYAGFAGFINQEYVELWNAEEILEANKDCEISAYLPGILGIGGNGAGELIGLEQSPYGQFRIVLSPLIGLSPENTIVIGNSFHDFLARLDRGENWFN